MMTNREMFLLATSVVFASTTAGMALRGMVCHGPRHGFDGRPPFEQGMDDRGGPDGDRGPEGKHGPRPDFFAMADTNKDGFLTEDEMLAGQKARLDELFATVDTNHDGKLSKDEMEKGRELMREKMKARFEAERKAAEAAPAAPEAAK